LRETVSDKDGNILSARALQTASDDAEPLAFKTPANDNAVVKNLLYFSIVNAA
jgi:hypothetical protein